MNIRHLLIAPLIAGVALLSACGGGDDSSGASDTAKQAYLQIVNGTGASFASDDDAVAAGEQACSELKSGTSMLDVVSGLESKAGGKAQAAAAVGAAAGTLCPDQKDKLTSGF